MSATKAPKFEKETLKDGTEVNTLVDPGSVAKDAEADRVQKRKDKKKDDKKKASDDKGGK